MNKNKNITFVMLIILFISSIIMYGCNSSKQLVDNDYNSNDVAYPAVFFEHTYTNKDNWDVKELVQDVEALEELIFEHNIDFDLSKYGTEYFTRNALIVYLFTCSHGGAKYKVEKIEEDQSALKIELIEETKHGANYISVIDHWLCAIEVAKNDMLSISKIDISINKKEV